MSMVRKILKYNGVCSNFLLLVLIAVFLNLGFLCIAKDTLTQAPLDSDFLKYVEKSKTLSSRYAQCDMLCAASSLDGAPLGLMPDPIDDSWMDGLGSSVKIEPSSDVFGRTIVSDCFLHAPRDEKITPSYDLREFNEVPSVVKDQDGCNSCWCFVAMVMLESNQIVAGSNPPQLFSEQHMNKYHGFYPPECKGGNSKMATSYLAGWKGPVLEEDVSYPYPSTKPVSKIKDDPNAPIQKHVQEIWWLPDRLGSTDNEYIKQAVKKNGAVFVGIRWDNSPFNYKTCSLYNKSQDIANHAVAIIGWDDKFSKDNFPKDNFDPKPEGDGAFIMRNSWGPNFGNNGYFYFSYYNNKMTQMTTIPPGAIEPNDNYTKKYEHDPIGIGNFGGFTKKGEEIKEEAYFANVFTTDFSNGNILHAVSFYTPTVNCSYDVWIYDDPTEGSPVGGRAPVNEKDSISGTVGYAGYHTIKLNKGYKISGEKFAVVARVKSPKCGFQVPMEYNIPGFISNSVSAKGQGYYSLDGISWTDTSTLEVPANVCLKVFARSE